MAKKKMLFAVALSVPMYSYADATQLELLAGVEAGIETETAMSHADLSVTQNVLSSQPIGVPQSWYNEATTTLYNITVLSHFQNKEQPCINYNLAINHKAQFDVKTLSACLNHEGNWIAHIEENTDSSL